MALPEAGVQLVAEGLSSFTSDMKKSGDAVQAFGKDAAQAVTGVDTLADAVKKSSDLYQDAAGRWRTASGRFASDAEKAAAGVETIKPAVKGAGDSVDDAGKRFDVFGEIVTGALRKIGELGVEALIKAGQAVTQFVGDSIGLAGDFEAGMLNFQAVAGKSVDASGLEQFRDLFIQIGKELPVSTSEVQQAATEMIKGGIDPAIVAAGGLRQNIQFAAAAMEGDLVGAAEISSKILGGWADSSATAQQKADFLTHSTDLLTKAANASAVDVHGLSLGIFNAQGIAKTAGVSFDDLTTTLAALAPRFASSSEAGNSLKNMIARLQPQTANQAGAMQALGLYTAETGSVFYDAQGNFVGFEKSAQLLQESLKGLTKEQQASLLQTIFGNDAMGSAAALADLGAEGYRNMAGAMAEANGVAENAALKQAGFNTALENAKGSVEALQITIGSYLLPVLTDLINNVVAPAINTFTDMADAIFGNDEAFQRLSPTAQAIVSVIDVLIDDVQNIIGAFDDAGAMSSEFAEALGLLASDLGLPGELIQDLALGVQDLISWFDEGGGAADDLGGAVDDLSGIWEKAQQVVAKVLDAYADIIDSILPQVQQFIADHGEEISAFFQKAWDSVIEIVNLAMELYESIVPPVLHAIASLIDDHGSEIQRILKAAWDVITTVITGALDLIKGVITLALDAIHGDWDAVWKDLQGITETVAKTISGVVEGALNVIAGIFDTTLDEIVTLWTNNWNQLVDIATSTDWGAVGRDVVDGIIAGLAGAWSSLVGWITERVSGLVDQALETIGAGSPAKEFMPVGQFATQGIMAGFSEWWPSLTKLVDKLGEDLIQQAEDLGMAVQSAIGNAFASTASIDRQIAKNLDALGRNVLPDFQSYAQGALKAAEDEARRFLDPTEGAKYFKMRSDQILEYEKLRKDLAEAETSDEQKRIKQQMLLINAAQTDEIKAFNANLNASKSGVESLMESIQALLGAKGVDEKGKPIELPGITENEAIRQITAWLNQLSNYSPNSGYTNPPMSAQQQYAGQTSYYRTTNLNMPIYTNQSPTVMQDSMAIAQAVLP